VFQKNRKYGKQFWEINNAQKKRVKCLTVSLWTSYRFNEEIEHAETEHDMLYGSNELSLYLHSMFEVVKCHNEPLNA